MAHSDLATSLKLKSFEVPVICIVDDDSWARGGLESLLLSLGYKTRTFASAELFLNSGAVHHATCLITDLHMPGLNGLELQATLQREGHRVPVIFVTAYRHEKHRARALEEGALCFLFKPYDQQTLLDCLTLANCGDADGSRLSPG
jgi:FixJ family two-component response regulator